MQTSDRGFEHIMSAVLEQKQVWEKLQTENRELRQQLLDLRAGRGIFIEIQNQRFELVWEEASRGGSEMSEAAQGKRAQSVKAAKASAQNSSAASSGVLEEMLLDELSSAVKNKMGSEGKPSGRLNEEQKATLRRELSGSFLLE
ncbi:MAG TPA: hypothetical protein VFN35_24380 [Ktedonobacteraceae bacterium]|nr:hypothetical protein [Ktedonobacteraceae bacterium]